MAHTIGLVEWTGTDQPSRIAWRRFHDRPLIEWVARRLTDAEWLDDVYFALPDGESPPVSAGSLPPDVRLWQSSEDSRLQRLGDLARQTGCDGIIGVRLDTPFVDPGLIDRLIRTANEGAWDYVTYICRDGRPVMHSQIGLGAEWFAAASLDRLAAVAEASGVSDVASLALQAGHGLAWRLLPLPDGLDHPELRLTLADDDDWETAQAIVETLGCESLDWPHIANWLDSHPHLLQQMASHSRAGSSPAAAARQPV